MRASHTVVLASNNEDKLNEFRTLLKPYPSLALISADEVVRNAHKIGLVETYATYEENALAKARLINHACHYPTLADDSGLEVEALQGKPGPRSARFAIAKAGQSQDDANIEKLLTELKGRPMDARKARFVCHLALVIEGIVLKTQGILEGTIAEAPMGANGFGYDPLFIPKGEKRTLGQMSDEEKNRISHRSAALEDLMVQVKLHGLIFAKP